LNASVVRRLLVEVTIQLSSIDQGFQGSFQWHAASSGEVVPFENF
jgi:hypothetical protein